MISLIWHPGLEPWTMLLPVLLVLLIDLWHQHLLL